jgi:hypothetical protein
MSNHRRCPSKWIGPGASALLLALSLLPRTVSAAEVSPHDDPLVRMPGTQPAPEGGVSLESPGRCLNCHGGYNTAVEPGHNWRGSMMAHAARDFLFWSALTVAAQDSEWAVGRPNASDLCLRCHSPMGWLEGRSDPTSGAALAGADFDGVQCDSCHRMYDPFFESTASGAREGDDWLAYWDETNASVTPSEPAAQETWGADAAEALSVGLFNGTPFYSGHEPAQAGWTENGGGQYFVAAGAEKRASFADASARHRMLYSRSHKSRFFCQSCHDVSNPVLANLAFSSTARGDGTTVLPSERQPASAYYHIERTFSEFLLSDYGRGSGAAGVGPFAPAVYATSSPDNLIARCQDCHMRDVVGVACNKSGVPTRPVGSVEHPESGQPLHDLTGGNAWVSRVLASAVAGSPNYDAVNAALLGQGSGVLTMDLVSGLGVDAVALLDGVGRAQQQLALAAALEDLAYDPATGALSFRVRNQTGHKLISGFPEGRRMFVNVRAYDSTGALIAEVNPYDTDAHTLRGLNSSGSPPLGPGEVHADELVYEVHHTSAVTGEEESFHVALATGRFKDNRIPPKGFRIAEAAARLSEPVWHGEPAPDLFSAAEYAGGYDAVALAVPPGAAGVEVTLYYQTTSREYVEFLRDEIRGSGRLTLPSDAYVVQTDPFFAALRAWGDTLWELWSHNADVPGAAPLAMTTAAWGGQVGAPCGAPAPTLLEARSGNRQVSLAWSDEHSGGSAVTGYAVSYDQAGKSQLLAEVGPVTSYTDSGLVNGQQYCYSVTSRTATCASAPSNVLCAVPVKAGGKGGGKGG